MVLALTVENHDPVLARGIPEHLGIALRTNQHGILVVELPGAPVVQAVGDDLAAIVPTGNERDHRRVGRVRGQSGGVPVIHHAGARLHAAAGLFFPESGLQFLPVDQIAAHRMEPALGPALCEQVVLAIVIDQAVEVVDPTLLLHAGVEPIHGPLARGEMELRAQRFLVEGRPGFRQALGLVRLHQARHVDVAPIAAGLVHQFHLRGLAHEPAHIPTGGSEVIALPPGRAAHDFAADQQVAAGVTLGVAAADTQGDESPRDRELGRGEGSGGRIAVDFAAGHDATGSVLDLQLREQTAGSRAFRKGCARSIPIAVVVLSKPADGDVLGASGENCRRKNSDQQEPCFLDGQHARSLPLGFVAQDPPRAGHFSVNSNSHRVGADEASRMLRRT